MLCIRFSYSAELGQVTLLLWMLNTRDFWGVICTGKHGGKWLSETCNFKVTSFHISNFNKVMRNNISVTVFQAAHLPGKVMRNTVNVTIIHALEVSPNRTFILFSFWWSLIITCSLQGCLDNYHTDLVTKLQQWHSSVGSLRTSSFCMQQDRIVMVWKDHAATNRT